MFLLTRTRRKSPGLPFGGPGLGTGGGYLLSHFRSTIGVARFNFSVRNGKRWSPCAVATLVSSDANFRRSRPNKGTEGRLAPCKVKKSVEAERKIHSRNEKRNTVAQPELSFRTRHGVPAARTQYDATRLSYLGDCAPERVRAISTARLRTLPPVHLQPIDVVVFDGPDGDLILRGASCLDAFSTYPDRTRLPGSAAVRHNRYTGGPSNTVLSY